ncbi:MAG: STAS domain-containing protein [Thermoleophilia bacterium]
MTAGEVPEDRGAPGAQVGLRIATEEHDGWVVVAFSGELDLEESGRAEAALAEARARAVTGVTADLRDVSFLGSTGIRILLEARDAAVAAGLRSGVLQGDGAARRLIELLGLTEELDAIDADG